MEPLSQLDRVAGRLNRLALQRALYRTAGIALLSAAVLGPAALWLSPGAFTILMAVLVGGCLGVGLLSFWWLRRRWTRRLEAARWVEHEIDLDERLLTLVTAPADVHDGPLWPELEADNRSHQPDWGEKRLRIPPVPANVALLVLGALAAAMALAPGGGDVDRPPPPPGFLQPPPEEPPRRSDAVPPPGSSVAEGELSGEGVGEEAGKGQGPNGSVLAKVQARLGERFAESLVASALGEGTQEEESDDESATDMRGDLPDSDLGDSVSQAGGMTPPEGMGHIVQDDADDDGQTVRRFESEGGDGTTASSKGGVRKGEAPKEGTGTGAPSPGDGKETDRDPDAPVMLSQDATQKVSGSGGSGPGDTPGTGPLLAKSPLDLRDGRGVARFSLSLGAMSASDGSEGGTLDSDIRSSIAEGERGEQAADHGVLHPTIPPEYETVVKRVFERNT